MTVLMISDSGVEQLISMADAVNAVEDAFEAKGFGKVQVPPKSYIFFERFNGDFRVMPAYLEKMGAAGVKVVNVHPDNPKKHNLPTVMASIILLSPETGNPLAIMDGTRITKMRTGAAGAVAAKYLARKDSSSASIIGAGTQAKTQLSALDQIFELDVVRAYDLDVEQREQFASSMENELGLNIEPVGKARKAVKNSDIVVTTTPVRTSIVQNDWVSNGTHINAIGADAKGKQELDLEILKRGKIVVDDWEQASHSGEINVPISESKLSRENIHADIGEVVAGKKTGRGSDTEITVFDSTGLAVQDIAVAWKVYTKALEKEIGEKINLF